MTGPRAGPPPAHADVGDVADALPGEARPRAAADAAGEVTHAVEHGVDLRDDVLAVYKDRLAARRAQRGVEGRAVFGHVDPRAAEHRVDSLAQARVVRQPQQELQRLVGDAGLRVVEE